MESKSEKCKTKAKNKTVKKSEQIDLISDSDCDSVSECSTDDSDTNNGHMVVGKKLLNSKKNDLKSSKGEKKNIVGCKKSSKTNVSEGEDLTKDNSSSPSRKKGKYVVDDSD